MGCCGRVIDSTLDCHRDPQVSNREGDHVIMDGFVSVWIGKAESRRRLAQVTHCCRKNGLGVGARAGLAKKFSLHRRDGRRDLLGAGAFPRPPEPLDLVGKFQAQARQQDRLMVVGTGHTTYRQGRSR